MSDVPTYSLAELVEFRDCLDGVLDVLDAHPPSLDTKRQLRRNGFTLNVKFGRGADLPVLATVDGGPSVEALVALGHRPGLVSQLLNQLIATMEGTP